MGSSLLLLPGLLCDASVWEAQVGALRSQCDVRAFPHFYGHVSLEGMAAAVLQAAPERFHLAGHSMGGRVAFEIYRLAPERVRSLVLLDTGVTPAEPHEALARGSFVDLARREGMAAVAARWLPPMVAPARLGDAALMGRLTAMVCRTTPEIFAGQQRALLSRPDVRPRLIEIACPTLVGCGAEDSWSPLAQHQEIAAAIPGAQLVAIPESGHMVSVEAPDAVSNLLRGWLDRQDQE